MTSRRIWPSSTTNPARLASAPSEAAPDASLDRHNSGADMTQTQAIDAVLLQRLRTLIGHRCEHEGQVWRLIDILPDEGLAVLESVLARPPIQMDQYGRASHRADAILQVRILDPVEGELTLEMQDLMECLQATIHA
jgi:hypothetical protein